MSAPGRTITGKLTNEPAFWKEVQRAAFLLENLKDDDLNWGQPYFYLRRVKSLLGDEKKTGLEAEFEVVSNLYLAWISIAIQIDTFQDFEIDPWWLYRLDASVQHIFERVLPVLTTDTQNKFFQWMPAMHKASNEKINIDLSNHVWTDL
jgi:hypothetical protein